MELKDMAVNIKYILDSREKALQKVFESRNISFVSEQLDLGDVAILFNFDNEQQSAAAKKLLGDSDDNNQHSESSDKSYTVLIERKSFLDLKASMEDGRYHDQKSRYKQLQKGSVYYILENNDPNFKHLDKKAYHGMYIHTVIRDQISVFLGNSVEDTADIILKIAKTIQEFGIPNTGSVCLKDTQIKKKKAKGKDVYIGQLCCISGISTTKAQAIAEKYGNLMDLLTAVKNNTFKVKGIGPGLLEKLKDGLLIQTNDTVNISNT